MTTKLAFNQIGGNTVNVKDFGAVGDGATDDTAALLAFRDALASTNAKGFIPAGTYKYTSSPNWGFSDLNIEGEGKRKTILKCTGAGRAFNIDPSEYDLQFRYNLNLKGFTVEGNSSSTAGIYAENIAGCTWIDLDVREGNNSTGIAFDLRLAVSCTFINLTHSINAVAQTSTYSEGLRLSASPSKLLNSTDNTIINPIMEGSSVAGIRLLNADSNHFLGGTAQSNTGRGILAATARMNTFIGLFFENNGQEDVLDAARSSKYVNCSSAHEIVLASTARLCTVDGGLHERLEVQAGATNCALRDLEFNGFASGAGGIFDSGTNTKTESLYDFDTSSYYYPSKPRTNITVGASPFSYTNDTGHVEQVLIRGGTITQVLWTRGGDSAIVGGGGEGANVNDQFLLAPGDGLTVSYSVAPAMNAIEMSVTK